MSSAAHNSSLDKYDIIFAGGGTAACVTAGRLATVDPSLKILILEAGPHTRELQEHVQPARFLSNFASSNPPFRFNASRPSEALDGRSVVVPSARCIGGGSSVNFAMYTRAAASDFDDWETVYGNAGWGSKDIIPLLRKAETYQPGFKPEDETHGDSGPIMVSYSEENINIGTQFLDVARAYDPERGFTDDTNDFFTCNRYGKWPKFVDRTSGKRSDTPHHYIYNKNHNNLKIQDQCCVKRVIFEGDRAIGVEYIDEKAGRIQGATEVHVHVAYASRLVVVSGGAFGSPAILERSGIGAANVLKSHSIQQIVDLPGVGEHYMDHDGGFRSYFANEDADTLDVIFKGSDTEIQPYVDEWAKIGKGLLSHNGLDAGIRIRPDAKDLKELGPAFGQLWQDYFVNAPDKPVAFIGTMAGNVTADTALPGRKYFSIAGYSAYPNSFGRVHITSGSDVYAPLDFEIPFLTTESGVRIARWIYKKGREFARRMEAYRGVPELNHPRFPVGSTAAPAVADGPVKITDPDIVYTAEDDEAIDKFNRENIATCWHSVGTCAMKPRESGGVVDSRLNVYGVRNLKVSDLSIAPANVGANTYSSAIAVGEKSAMIIAEELGIRSI